MSTDIVFPSDNEEDFITRAQQLGYSTLVFAYSNPNDLASAPRGRHKGSVLHHALFISSGKKDAVLNSARRAQKEGVFALVNAQNALFNRFVVEKTSATALVDVEHIHAKDHLHFRRSGLDQVLCAFAAEKHTAIISSLRHLFEVGRAEQRALVLGRMMQNIRFCQKYNVPYGLVSFASEPSEMKGAHDIRSLLITLGMSGPSLQQRIL